MVSSTARIVGDAGGPIDVRGHVSAKTTSAMVITAQIANDAA